MPGDKRGQPRVSPPCHQDFRVTLDVVGHPRRGSTLSERPAWAQRLRSEREARGWSRRDAVRALQAHADRTLPDEEAMRRSLMRWENGEHLPDDYYRPLLAKMYGTVTTAIFPADQEGRPSQLITVTGMDAMELLGRLRTTDVDAPTLDALRITVERLCSEYASEPAEKLHGEALEWLRRINGLREGRLTLSQHREVLTLAGWLALLVSCLEHDMTDSRTADATRVAALSLGQEAGAGAITGWAHEIRAWMALTHGDLRGVIAASEAGQAAAANQGVAVQLAAQKAKAWARIGDRRQVELALDEGRKLLEGLPYPENLSNHFTVDPSKFDFYAMDCYRALGEDRLAQTLAEEVIRAGTHWDGQEKAPMRIAEAQITLGVVAARQGDAEEAVAHGRKALGTQRRSMPSLLLVAHDLTTELQRRYADATETREYLEMINDVRPAQNGTGH